MDAESLPLTGDFLFSKRRMGFVVAHRLKESPVLRSGCFLTDVGKHDPSTAIGDGR